MRLKLIFVMAMAAMMLAGTALEFRLQSPLTIECT